MDNYFAPVAAACAVAVVSAVFVVISRGAIRAVVALLAHSLSIAALYALLAASLVAVAQLLIYSGAIVVLFLFVVALLPPGGRELTSQPMRLLAGIGVGLVLVAALFLGLQPAFNNQLPLLAANAATSAASIGTVPGIADELFSYGNLVVPFELTAPLLLVAIIGAVAVWRRQGAPS